MIATEGMGLKKPVTVPRPGHVRAAAPREAPAVTGDVSAPAQAATDDAYKRGVATLMSTSRGVMRGGAAA